MAEVMTEINFIDPPNRPMEAVYKPPKGPVLKRDIIFLDINNEGHILVGSVNVTETFWDSSIQYFKNWKSFQGKHPLGYHNSMNIFNDGKFSRNNIILAESPYYLKVITSSQDSSDGHVIWKDCQECSDNIINLSLWNDETKVLSCGKKYITVWDFGNGSEGIKKIHEYSNYHTDDITSVAANKASNNVFGSTSIDRRACLWDSRMEMPALVLYQNEFCSLRSIEWSEKNPDIVAVGSDAGDVYLLDITQPKEFLNVQHCFNHSIHKMAFSKNGNLAICGDTSEIQVYNCKNNDFELERKINEHSKIVRAVAWHEDILYSSGFDTKICEHTF